jgi:dTDP-glucose 4,6-dehydratase
MTQYKNILVTGGCGFIGSNFIRHIYHAHLDYRIFNLDALTYAGNPENLADLDLIEGELDESDRRYIFLKGDVADRELLDVLFAEHHFEFIFHFAAETHVDRSFFHFANFVRTNVEGTLALAALVLRYGGRMVHISTDEVYGSIPEGFVTEGAPFNPSNPYASSKAAADMLLQSFTRNYGAPILTVRATNNYGKYQYPEKLIPLGITNLLDGLVIPIHGSGLHLRQWLHVEDFARAIDLVALKGEDGAIYNVAGEHESNLGVLEIIAEHLGKDLSLHKEHTPDRPNQDARYAIDASRIKQELGWRPQHSFRESLPDVVDWYIAKEGWWRKIKEKREFLDHYEKQRKAEWH